MQKFVLDRRERKIPVNPSQQFAESLVEEASGCEEVISCGGGSTIDVGKYVSFSLKVKHTAIPTTAGSGSEVTRYAVLTDENGHKRTMTDERLLPDCYVLEPSLLTSLSDFQTLSSGMDVVCHAFESLWSAYATRESRELATLAAELAITHLNLSRKFPKDATLRLNMLTAANLAGRAINITGTNICHAVSYALTRLYDIPHGIACGLTLSAWSIFFPSPAYEARVRWWASDIMSEKSIRPIRQIDTKLVAEEAMQYEKIQTGQKRVTLEDVKMILEKSLCT